MVHIISGDLWAGAEVQAYTLLKELAKRHDLLVILLNDGQLAKQLVSASVPVEIVDESQFSFIQILSKVGKLVLEFDPEVIHTHREKENVIGAISSLRSRRAVCVSTIHGSAEFTPSLKQRLQSLLDFLTGKFVHKAIIAVSNDLAAKLVPKFGKEKVRIIRNGVDPIRVEALANRTQVNLSDSKFNIAFIGRLTPVKRVDLFLETAQLILENESEKDFCFHIIGDGDLKAAMQEYARKLEIDDFVVFHGHLNNVYPFLKRMDAVVLTSDHEGLPMTLLESMALNIPVIAHNVGGIPELMAEHYPDLLVDENKPVNFARAVRYSLDSEVSVALPDNFSAKANAEQVESLYKSIRG